MAPVLKGIGNGAKETLDVDHIKALNVDWFYTWGNSPRLATPANGVYAEFVPMLWSDSATRTSELPSALAALNPKAQHVLGFNEPDLSSQSNMLPLRALGSWNHLDGTGLRVGSPATISPSRPWMDQFMGAANVLRPGANGGLKVDFVACHIYQNPHVGTFLNKIDALHDKWGKPVWVTETGVADWSAVNYGDNRYGRTEINNYLSDLWDALQTRPWLERFAWKTRASTDPQMGTGALYHTDGRLTTTGQLYASL